MPARILADTGIGCGSFAIGAVAQRYGFRSAFLVAAALASSSIPIFITMSRRIERAHAEAFRATAKYVEALRQEVESSE